MDEMLSNIFFANSVGQDKGILLRSMSVSHCHTTEVQEKHHNRTIINWNQMENWKK